MPQEIRTRFAPSPTGFLHVGGLRTALYNYLWAKKNNGKFILRIEDTDKTREVLGALENIIESLKQFGLDFDEGPIKQSDRLETYKKHAQELIDKGNAYYCFCTTGRLEELRTSQEVAKLPPKYDKQCLKLSKKEIQEKLSAGENYVVRLNVPEHQTIRFTDLVHGEVAIATHDIDDQVLLKSDGYPTYHLANVVDDHEMNITHVIRGDEWIPSTPKHILLYSSFGWESPQFAHLPLLLSKTKKKLSKREGDVAVRDFLEKGYLPEALLNFVALLGWNPKTEEEIFSLDELVQEFSLEKVNKAGAILDLDKLDWFNGVYIRSMDASFILSRMTEFFQRAGIVVDSYPKDFLLKIIKLEQERLKKLSEIGERVAYFFNNPVYNAELLRWKSMTNEEIKKSLTVAEKIISNFQLPISKDEIEKQFLKEIGAAPKGPVLWPLRVALTGLNASPGPFEILDAFMTFPNGRDIVLSRISKASEML